MSVPAAPLARTARCYARSPHRSLDALFEPAQVGLAAGEPRWLTGIGPDAPAASKALAVSKRFCENSPSNAAWPQGWSIRARPTKAGNFSTPKPGRSVELESNTPAPVLV